MQTEATTKLKMEGAHYIDASTKVYEDEENKVWAELYGTRMKTLPEQACAAYMEGLDKLEMPGHRVPLQEELSERLQKLTGWQMRAVDGFVPAQVFFDAFSRRTFPATVEVRPWEQLEYLQEPDVFHDVFGHLPMHTDPVFADFAQEYGVLASSIDDEDRFDALGRLYWYTVEFGLIRQAGELKLYGAGLMSSFGEAANVFRGGPEIRPFDLDEVITTPFRIDIYQPLLFVIDGFEQLLEAVETLRKRWAQEDGQ